MSKIKIITVALIVSTLVWLACETVTPPLENTQTVLTERGWEAFLQNELDDANEYFNLALEEDPAYPDAFNGLGWVALKNEDYTTAVNNLLTATTNDPNLISGLVGLAYAEFYYTDPDEGDHGKPFYNDVVELGEDAIELAGGTWDNGTYIPGSWNWNDECPDTENFPNNRDGTLSLFDIHMLTALGYFNLAEMNNTVKHINAMRVIIGETGDFNPTNWDEVVAELARLEGEDPS